jgi:hypothetical protein
MCAIFRHAVQERIVMTKTLLLGLTLLLSTAWMMAQDTTGGQTSTPTSNSSETTIQGCLSNASGTYTLTDSTGVTYQLMGDNSKLSENVDKEVQAKGSVSASSAGAGAGASPDSAAGAGAGTGASAGAGAGASNAAQTFNFTKIKKVADSCKSAK